jgi:hypothetical protein
MIIIVIVIVIINIITIIIIMEEAKAAEDLHTPSCIPTSLPASQGLEAPGSFKILSVDSFASFAFTSLIRWVGILRRE